MVLFFWFLNHVNRINTAVSIKIVEMSSRNSPYFIPKEGLEFSKANFSSKRQTRSSKTQTTIKLNETVVVNETANDKMKMKRGNKVVAVVENVAKQHFLPVNWEIVYENIKTMRIEKNAPVDQMGAEQCADSASPPEVKRFQVLISLMLSSQTKDQVTFAAMEKLKKHGLSVENIINTDEDVIANLIHPVGFWKKKASYIKRTATILASQYNSDIPQTVEELCKLPGVGQKMAVLTVNIGWKKSVGIGVDTHVHRIANRLGWTRLPTKTPERTKKELEDWLPLSLWDEVNVLLVGFGQQRCTPIKPQCNTCLNKNLCPVGNKSRVDN